MILRRAVDIAPAAPSFDYMPAATIISCLSDAAAKEWANRLTDIQINLWLYSERKEGFR